MPPGTARIARTLRGVGGKSPTIGPSENRIVTWAPSRLTAYDNPGAFNTTRPK